MRKQVIGLLLCAGAMALPECALAQGGYRSSDPNFGHFYMGRQEWQYIDQSPVVTGTPPGPPGAQGQQPGAAPARPAPLPKAGWVPYSSTIPSVQNALPQVNNGVPKPMPAAAPRGPGGPAGMRGKAGSLKGRPAAAAAPKAPQGIQTYNSYKGYGGGAPAPAPSAFAGAGASTSTNVKGSVLHWARPKARTY